MQNMGAVPSAFFTYIFLSSDRNIFGYIYQYIYIFFILTYVTAGYNKNNKSEIRAETMMMMVY